MSNIDKLFKEHKVIVLPKDTRITEGVIMRLDNLLEFASPEELKDNLIEIYHTYIIHASDALPPGFEKFSSNLYFLIDFFKKAEDEMRQEKGLGPG